MLMDKISSLPLTPPAVVTSGASVSQLLDEVRLRKVGCVLVYEAGKLAGIITERDVLMKVVARDVKPSEPVDKFMTPDPITISAAQTLGDATSLMQERHIRHIPVLDDDGVAMGVLSIKDIIEIIAESFPAHVLNLPPRPHQKLSTREGA